jgi:hypothetical protein
MTEDPSRPLPRTRRARRLALLAVTVASLGLWTGAAGASDAGAGDAAAPAATPAASDASLTTSLPGWSGETTDSATAALLARIANAMGGSTTVDDTGNRWTGVGDVGNRWTGSPQTGGWGNRWDARNR